MGQLVSFIATTAKLFPFFSHSGHIENGIELPEILYKYFNPSVTL